MEKIFYSLIIGFAVAAIPGAVFIETIRRTITKGSGSAFLLVFGEFLGHVSLFLMIFLGFSRFFVYEFVNPLLYLGGAVLMLGLGYDAFKSARHTNEARELSKNSFLIGLGFSMSDPYIIGLWITLSGTYLSSLDQSLAIMHIFFIASGFLLFFLPLIFFTSYLGKRLPDHYMVWISRIGGVILIFTACVFLKKFIFL